MASINQTITVTASQGQDTISKNVYVSGENKTVLSVATNGSGIQSGISFNVAISGIYSVMMNHDQANTRIVVYSLSGSVTFNPVVANNPLIWWSGNMQTNPLLACSGSPIGISVQQLSGFVSGTLDVQVIGDATL